LARPRGALPGTLRWHHWTRLLPSQLPAVVRRCRWARVPRGCRGSHRTATLPSADEGRNLTLCAVCVSRCTAIVKLSCLEIPCAAKRASSVAAAIAVTPDAQRVSFSRPTTSLWLAGTKASTWRSLTEELLRSPQGSCSSRRRRICIDAASEMRVVWCKKKKGVPPGLVNGTGG
jgi:hypothetical protein